jgi:hypothetical protein
VIRWSKLQGENLKEKLIELNENISQLYNNDYFKVVEVNGKENLVGFSWYNVKERTIFFIKDLISGGKETEKVNELALKTLNSMKELMNSKIPFWQFYECNIVFEYIFWAPLSLLNKIKKSYQLRENKDVQKIKLPRFPKIPKFQCTLKDDRNLTETVENYEVMCDKKDFVEKCYDGEMDFTKVFKLKEPLKCKDRNLINVYFYKEREKIFKKNVEESKSKNVEEFVKNQITSLEKSLEKVRGLILKNESLYFIEKKKIFVLKGFENNENSNYENFEFCKEDEFKKLIDESNPHLIKETGKIQLSKPYGFAKKK